MQSDTGSITPVADARVGQVAATPVIDTQVHAPELSAPHADSGPARWEAQTEALLAAMDAVGVTHAVVAPRHDAEMGAFAVARHPNRLARVVMLDPETPDIDSEVASLVAISGVVGLRQVVSDYIGDRGAEDLLAGKFDCLFAAAERAAIPVFLLAPGHARDLESTARKFPRLPLVVDHFGLRQYPTLSMDQVPAAKIDELVALAAFPNVYVKFCGGQLLAAEPFPHADIWPRLREVVDAFDSARLMWASDFTRLRMVAPGALWRGTYAESLHFIRDTDALSQEEKADLLCRTARRLLRWPDWPPPTPAD